MSERLLHEDDDRGTYMDVFRTMSKGDGGADAGITRAELALLVAEVDRLREENEKQATQIVDATRHLTQMFQVNEAGLAELRILRALPPESRPGMYEPGGLFGDLAESERHRRPGTPVASPVDPPATAGKPAIRNAATLEELADALGPEPTGWLAAGGAIGVPRDET